MPTLQIERFQTVSRDLRELSMSPISGQFNTNVFMADGPRIGLMRVPKRNPDMLANLIDEYRQIGFTGSGGRLRIRTSREQYEFSHQAVEVGLRVLPAIGLHEDNVLYPFLPQAQTLDQYLPTAGENLFTVVYDLIEDMQRAHEHRLVYGDRWAGNILVDPKLGPVHIDFDIEIRGPFARELDLAQLIYHTLWAAGKEAGLLVLAQLLGQMHEQYDLNVIARYLRGLSKYFDKTKVGVTEDQIEQLISLTRAVVLKEYRP